MKTVVRIWTTRVRTTTMKSGEDMDNEGEDGHYEDSGVYMDNEGEDDHYEDGGEVK